MLRNICLLCDVDKDQAVGIFRVQLVQKPALWVYHAATPVQSDPHECRTN